MVTRNNRLWHVVRTIDIPAPPATEPQAWLAPYDATQKCKSSLITTPTSFFTTDFYVMFDEVPSGGLARVLFGTIGDRSPWAFIHTDTELQAQVRYTFAEQVVLTYPIADLVDGYWHRISLTNKADGIYLYIDGVEVDYSARVNSGLHPGTTMVGTGLGCHPLDGIDMSAEFCQLCDFRIWKRKLSNHELLRYASYKSSDPISASLAHYWPADEGSGFSVADAVGGSHASLTDDTWWAM